ncbi:MAG: hypothetical protein DRI95_11500, partial [Bacteroidetes bacterium]
MHTVKPANNTVATKPPAEHLHFLILTHLGIEKAIEKIQNYLGKYGKKIPVEIEVRNMEELSQVMKTGWVVRIMLDNFTVKKTREVVQIINEKYETESSGGINLDTIRGYAECGVDFVSV